MLKAQRLIKRLHQLLAAEEQSFQLPCVQGPHSLAQFPCSVPRHPARWQHREGQGPGTAMSRFTCYSP